MRSALDRFLLAFKSERLNADPFDLGHYIQLYWDDRARFDLALQAEWEARRPGPYGSLCRVLDLNGELGGKPARRLVRLLLQAGRFGDALGTLQDPRFGLLGDAAGRLDHARAFLGLGQVRAARAALARALELDAGAEVEAAEIEAAIAALEAAGQGAGQGSGRWSDTRRFIDQCLELGAVDPAARALLDFLGSGELAARDLPDFHDVLDTVISLNPPRVGVNLLFALERIYPGEERRAALRRINAVLAAEDDEAALEALLQSGQDLATTGALAWARAGRLEAAIPALGQLSVDFHRDAAIRVGLARAIGQDFLARHPLRLEPSRGRRKIFDLFLFRDELRMLQVKLHEMADWVDHFVIVEARQTHAGAQKPLVFQENRSQFAAFEDKIVHVVVDSFPPHARHPWAREMYQRESGLLGLAGRCAEDDLVIVSDTDEVVSRSAVEGFDGDYARLAMERSRYYLNYRRVLPPEEQIVTASLWRASYLARLGLSYGRIALRADKRSPRRSNAGWHFTSIADSAGIVAKLKQAAHQEYADIPEARLANRLRRVRQGKFEEGWERCELDAPFPAYIRDRRAEFEDVLI